jgi:hypothetical protein
LAPNKSYTRAYHPSISINGNEKVKKSNFRCYASKSRLEAPKTPINYLKRFLKTINLANNGAFSEAKCLFKEQPEASQQPVYLVLFSKLSR